MTRIAVFGANGSIGSSIALEALERGHQVTAVVRDRTKVPLTNPSLTITTGDVLDPESVAAAARGHDVLVSAVGGGDGPGHLALIRPAAVALIAGLRSLGNEAPRLIAVGGAGSLRTRGGRRLWDADGVPEPVLQIMHAHGDALEYYRTVVDVSWTNISPPSLISPGERTGLYRTDTEDLVVDDNGDSHISTEDYAVAVVDEIENPKHLGTPFTVGY